MKSLIFIFAASLLAPNLQADPMNEPIPCDGTRIVMSLAEPNVPMKPALLKGLPFVKAGVSEPVAAGGTFPQMRLEACLSDDNSTVVAQRAVLTSAYAGPTVLLTKDIQNVTGLSEALFGNTQKFKMDLMEDEDSKTLVYGLPNGMVALLPLYKGDSGKWQLSSIAVPVGRFVEGDPFANLKCPLGKSAVTSNFELGTAKFETEMCIFMGGGETTGYEITSMKVTDTNSKLAAGTSGKSYVFDGATLKSALNYRWNHHNACDSFVLTVKESAATYAVTSAPMAGCGAVVPGAPPRDFDDPDHRAKFVNRYGSESEAGFLKGGHFFRLY